MARNLGDRAVGSTIDFKFNTHDTDGAPITLAGSPALACYKGNSTTEDIDGISLTTDFDARTGMHHVRINTAADAAFYSSGGNFQVVITQGTVDGISVAGVVIAEFTLGIGVDAKYWNGSPITTPLQSADDVWSSTTRTLTANPGLTQADVRSAVGMASANLDTQLSGVATASALTAVASNVTSILQDTDEIGVGGAGLTSVPWNSAWASNVQAQCANALNAYDPPTAAEMNARTLAAADYATATNLAATKAVTDAVKQKTDQLTFTKAGEVDAALRSIRSYGVTGDGTEGNKFGVQP